ncbi:MAG: hypothetical protein KatS3mg034_0189 [Vicingaceae bacterium]|nr:MAG: hypothetical protein KatS3mg034_0189 [Vicingaceae bacterium]
MKNKLLYLILCILLSGSVFCQEYKILWGQKEYMIRDDIELSDGQTIENYTFKSGIPDGYYIVYQQPGFKLKKMEGLVKNGKMEGLWIYYDKKGRKARELTFKDGLPHGDEKYFNTRNQEIILKYTYEGGIKHGEYYVKYANGQLWEKGFYRNGMPDGEWTYWDIDGNVKRIRYFKNGRLVKQENY